MESSQQDANSVEPVHDRPTLYVATKIYGNALLAHAKAKSIDLNPVRLETTWNSNFGFHPNGWEVAALDDPEIASKVELLYADLPIVARYWRNMPNLKWAHTAFNGVDMLMNFLKEDEPLPTFKLTKTDGRINAPLITEYVIGYIIATERCFFEAKDAQRNTEWRQMAFSRSKSLTSLTVGVLGVGNIGRYLAKACKALGMTVWGLTRKPRSQEEDDDVDVYRTLDGLADLLQHCDYVVNVLPSTPDSRGLLSGQMLENCKGSVFINVGRGDVVDEESIVNALRQGWLRGAVLDVFDEEPVPASSPLWSLPGVLITPHVSGWSSRDQHMAKLNECFFTNYQRYISGQPLVGELDWNQGY